MDTLTHFKRKYGDDVVLDDLLLLLAGQHGVQEVLLLVEDEPVEAGEEDDAEEDVGEVASGDGDELDDEQNGVGSQFLIP